MVPIIRRIRLPPFNTNILCQLIATKKEAIRLLSNNHESTINDIWKKTLILLLMLRKSPQLLRTTRSNHFYIAKSNWTSIIHKIRTNEENVGNTLPSLLFQLILSEFSCYHRGSNSKFIYTISDVKPSEKKEASDFESKHLEIDDSKYKESLNRRKKTAFFPLEIDHDTDFFSSDSDDEESPLLTKNNSKFSQKWNGLCHRISCNLFKKKKIM